MYVPQTTNKPILQDTDTKGTGNLTDCMKTENCVQGRVKLKQKHYEKTNY